MAAKGRQQILRRRAGKLGRMDQVAQKRRGRSLRYHARHALGGNGEAEPVFVSFNLDRTEQAGARGEKCVQRRLNRLRFGWHAPACAPRDAHG